MAHRERALLILNLVENEAGAAAMRRICDGSKHHAGTSTYESSTLGNGPHRGTWTPTFFSASQAAQPKHKDNTKPGMIAGGANSL